MIPAIQSEIERLVNLVRSESPPNAVGFNLYLNSSEYIAEYRYRDAASLKIDGISMRSLNGQFIKALPNH